MTEPVTETLPLAWGEETLRVSGRLWLRVRGTSMLPWLRPGDTVVVHPGGTSELGRGDLVVFARRGILVTHRVIQTRDKPEGMQLVTKGDACQDADDPIQKDELLGRVVRILRGKRCLHLDTARQRFKGALVARFPALSRIWYFLSKLAPATGFLFRSLLAARLMVAGMREGTRPNRAD